MSKESTHECKGMLLEEDCEITLESDGWWFKEECFRETENFTFVLKIKFCPFCGRLLETEAKK